MVKQTLKKRKLVNKPEETAAGVSNKIQKKLKKKKKKLDKTSEKVPNKETQTTYDSDSSDSEPEAEKIQKILEPYTKDLLIDFIVDAAVNDDSLFNRIKDVADKDISHRKIFVYGLGWDTTTQTLVSAFEKFGEIEDCKAVTNHKTGKARGYGFVLFKSRQSTMKALKEPRKMIGNRIASCQLASLGPPGGPQSQDSIGKKIYVSNVSPEVDSEKLRAFFAKFGEIETGPIGFDMRTGKSRGFAMFIYKTEEGAKQALREPYKMFEGNQLHCQKATEGKNKIGGGAASVTTALQPVPVQDPVLAAVAAAQNMALYGLNPGLNPLYGGLMANPNAGFIAAPGSVYPMAAAAGGLRQGMMGPSQVGQVGGAGGKAVVGLGSYDGLQSQGLVNSIGGNTSVLGSYGGSSAASLGLKHAYPSSQIGQSPSSRPQGVGGSFSGYPPHL